MAKYPGLVQRGKRGTYWFRRRSKAGSGLPEINVSLRTTDWDTAIERWVEHDAKARALSNGKVGPQAAPASRDAEIVAAFKKHLEQAEIDHRLKLGVAEAHKRSPDWHALARKHRDRLKRKVADAKVWAVTRNLSEYAYWIEDNFSGYHGTPDLWTLLVRTDIRVHEAMLADDVALLADVVELDAKAPKVDASPKLSKFTEDYIDRRGKGLSDERAATIRATVRDLTQISGDKSVTSYDAADASTFEAVMLALPPNWMKNRILRKLSITKAAEKAKALGMKRQAAKNIRKKWAALSTVFENAALTFPVKNPFVAKALIVDDGIAANEQWDTFKSAELRTLFASDLPGPLHWLTWLGRYTGARLNELCQLSTDLVRQHGDVHYLYFSATLRLKTREKKSSVRAVPLHPDLIAAGFLEYVGKCDGLLFSGLTRHISGRYSDAQSKAFTRHLKDLGLKRPKLSFHSLRHSFGEAFKRHAPRDVETRERLLGHVVAGVAGRYGGSYEAEAADMELLAHRAGVLAGVRF